MRKFRALWTLPMFAAALGLSLAGCGSSSPSSSAAKAPIKIGAMLALSGAEAPYNVPILNALKMAQGEINAKGGMNGHKITLVVQDSGGTPQGGVSAFNTLVGDGVKAVIGVASPVIAATLPLAEQDHVVLLDISTVDPNIWLSTKRVYSFSIYPKANVEMAGQADYVYKTLGDKRAAVLAVNDATGQPASTFFSKEFKADGGQITNIVLYPPGTTDFRSYLTKLEQGHPQAISFINDNPEDDVAIKQAADMGLHAQWIGYSAMVTQQLVAVAGSAGNGVLATSVGWNPGSNQQSVQSFISTFQKKFGSAPSVYAAMGYDGLHILAKVMQKSGSSPKAIASGLKGVTYQGATGNTEICSNGLANKPIYINKVVNGQWQIVDTIPAAPCQN